MDQNLTRVTNTIGEAVKKFVEANIDITFYATDLITYVINTVPGPVAPSSPTRVMQNMKKQGLLNYELVSRAKSLYRGLPLEQKG